MAVVAAKGVDFLAPLKPDEPVEPQRATWPSGSVTVMMVLLKVAVM